MMSMRQTLRQISPTKILHTTYQGEVLSCGPDPNHLLDTVVELRLSQVVTTKSGHRGTSITVKNYKVKRMRFVGSKCLRPLEVGQIAQIAMNGDGEIFSSISRPKA